TFRYYNNTYTGNNSIFVCTNGFITVGSPPGFSYFSNDDLSGSSQQNTTAICPYWDDLFPSSANEVLGRYDDLNGDGIFDRFVVQWNQADHYPGGYSLVTFQAELYINTGTSPGKIVFNYVTTDFGDPTLSNGASATVGIKNDNTAGGGPDPELVWFDGSGQIQPIGGTAIQLTVGSGISGTKFEDLNGNGTRDPGENLLPGWTFFLDANGNGRLDPGEVSTTT